MNYIFSRKNVRKMLRYLIMFLTVFIITQFITECKVSYQTSFILASASTVIFALLDIYFPLIIL